ncbi:uncharacterized protein TRIVIDRAFT_209490, partial [Trichoderma virens Gv29-8]
TIAVSTDPQGSQSRNSPAATGQAAPDRQQKEATPSIPGKGKTTILALTPKKKRRFGGEFTTDNIPALQLNKGRANPFHFTQKPPEGLSSSLFSGVKKATATNQRHKSLTQSKIIGQLAEINTIHKARQTILISTATAIDEYLATFTTGHCLAAAKQIHAALATALKTFLSLKHNPGGPKNPDTPGSKRLTAQPPKKASANTSRSTEVKSRETRGPTGTAAAETTPPQGPEGAKKVTWAEVASHRATHNKNPQRGQNNKRTSTSNSKGPAPANENKEKQKPKTTA